MAKIDWIADKSDANGVGYAACVSNRTTGKIVGGTKENPVYEKVKHTLEVQQLDKDDASLDDDGTSITLVMPEGYTLDSFLDTINQGLRLDAQQAYHRQFAESGVKTANRVAVDRYCWSNVALPEVSALMKVTTMKGVTLKAINAAKDAFFEKNKEKIEAME